MAWDGRDLVGSERHDVIRSTIVRDLWEIDFKMNFTRSGPGTKQVGLWFGLWFWGFFFQV